MPEPAMPEPVMPEKDRLDLLIDSAIATYAESPAGLEERMMRACAAVRFQSPAKPRAFPVRRLLPWMIPLAAAACVLVALLIHNRPTGQPLQAHNPATPSAQQAPKTPMIAIHHQPRTPRPALKLRQQRVLAAAQPAPRLDVFPTPEPLTPQEQALAAAIARAPRPKLSALITAQKQSNEPLTIPSIQIEPIEPPDPGNR